MRANFHMLLQGFLHHCSSVWLIMRTLSFWNQSQCNLGLVWRRGVARRNYGYWKGDAWLSFICWILMKMNKLLKTSYRWFRSFWEFFCGVPRFFISGVDLAKALDKCPSRKLDVRYFFHVKNLNLGKLFRKPSCGGMGRIETCASLKSLSPRLVDTFNLKWMLGTARFLQQVGHNSVSWCKLGAI